GRLPATWPHADNWRCCGRVLRRARRTKSSAFSGRFVMAKKRPPGARRRGPTARRAEFSMDPASVMHRIESAVPLASVRPEHLHELLGEVREWLHGDWRMTDENGPVKLPENYSLFGNPQG